MATVERNTIIRDHDNHDGGAGLLLGLLFLMVAGLIFFLWTDDQPVTKSEPMLTRIERNVTIETPDITVKAPEPAAGPEAK